MCVSQKLNVVASRQVERVARHRQELDARWLEFLAWLEHQHEARTSFAVFERELWLFLLRIGCAAIALTFAQRWSRPTPKAKDGGGLGYDYWREQAVTVRTMCGVLEVEMSIYQRRTSRTSMGPVLVPQLAEVGLLPWAGGLSPNLVAEAVELSTRMPVAHVCEVMERFVGYVPSTRSILGFIDKLGPLAAEAWTDVPLADGEVVMIQADGRGLPRIRPEEMAKRCKPHSKGGRNEGAGRPRKKRTSKPRRTKGQKAKQKKRVTVGLITTWRQAQDGESWEMVGKKVVANFGGAEPVFRLLATELANLGPSGREVYFLSDGDTHLERLQKKHFPTAVSVVDFFHVCEYLWSAGETIHKEGSDELSEFVHELKGLLLADRSEEVLERLEEAAKAIPRTGPGTKGRRKRMADTIRYLNNRKPRLLYRGLSERGLDIGTGAIESAMRQVVAIRFDGPGMRWGERPVPLLALLVLRISGGWSHLRTRLIAQAHTLTPRQRMTPRGVHERSGAERRKQLKSNENMPCQA